MKYGLIVAYTENIGDDIQSLAAKQFLPRVDIYVDRDKPNKVHCDEEVKIIFNGWFSHHPENFPPAECLKPLFISFHAGNRLLSRRMVDYLKKHEPVGCRDLYTLSILKKKNVNGYFSGCLTLVLDYKYKNFSNEKKDQILIVDLDKEALKLLPRNLLNSSRFLSHYHFKFTYENVDKTISSKIKKMTIYGYMPKSIKRILKSIKYHLINKPLVKFDFSIKAKKFDVKYKLKLAEDFIKKYASAKLVITSRLHAALPAVAFGTPAILVYKNFDFYRFDGLVNFVHNFSLREFKRNIDKINWENPPPNPNQEKLKEIKRHLIEKCVSFVKNE